MRAAAVFADGLMLAATCLTLLLVACLVIARKRSLSSHVRHAIVLQALIAGPLLLVGFTLVRPGPVGCVSFPCNVEPSSTAAEAGHHYSLSAASKFLDAGTPEVVSLNRRSLPYPLPVGLGLWLAGTVLFGTRAVRRRLGLRRLLAGSECLNEPGLLAQSSALAARLELRRCPRLLRHPLLPHAVVGGIIRPAIFLPEHFAEQPAAERRMVLLHELLHVKRHDAATSLMVELTCALFWFHPLAWIASRRATHLQEMATDSSVIGRGVRASTYADYLLHTWRILAAVRIRTSPTLHSIAGECMITDRIRALLDPYARHGRPAASTSAAITTCFALLVGALIWSPAAAQQSHLLAQEDTAQLDVTAVAPAALDSLLRPLVINRMTDRYVAGAAISIVHDGRIVYAEGFGDRAVYEEKPVEPERTIFRIGSITKVLTGLAVMQLVDRQLIDIDADVNDYLGELRVPESVGEPVRVRHLLTHTAGFDQIGLDRHAKSTDAVEPLDAWLSGKLVRLRPPGGVSAYDTYGLTLAGRIVETVSGLPFEQYLVEHVFGPLGMHRSGISVPPALADDVAIGYGFAGEWEALPWEYMHTGPASTANATVVDMARLAMMFLSEGMGADSRVLSERSTRAMLTRQFTNHPEHPGYGYTFFEGDWNGIRTFSHAGSMSGFSAMLTLVPEHELGIFIAYNQESGALVDAVVPALFTAFFPDARPEPMRRRIGGVDASRFVGTYANNVYHHGNPEVGWRRRPVEVTRGEGEGSNAIVFDGAPAWPVAPLTFQREDGLLISFLEDDAGEIAHMVIAQAVYEKLE